MLRLLQKRLIHSVFLVVAVISVVFLTQFVIGDPVRALLPVGTPPEVIEQYRHTMGFDRPIIVQYLDYMFHAFQGDFGDSWWQRAPALPIALRPLGATFQLGITSILVALITGIPLGIYASFHPGSLADRLTTTFALVGVSLPLIFLCPLLLIIFAVKLGWLPVTGYGSWKNMVLPVIALACIPFGRIVQITRASMMDELAKQYVTTAHAKGLAPGAVLFRHALKNAILPVITVGGWEFVLLVSGSTIIVEKVLGWPGIGFMIWSSIMLRDTPLQAATAFVIAIVVVAINFFIDILYGIANPLVKFE